MVTGSDDTSVSELAGTVLSDPASGSERLPELFDLLDAISLSFPRETGAEEIEQTMDALAPSQ
jgi:hypothetical protein